MNLASVWNLPVIFLAENNGYAEATSSNFSVACDNIADRASAFGMPGITVDGFDFFAVYEAAGAAIERARQGGGPSLVEVKLSRYYGHFEGDQQTYRAPAKSRTSATPRTACCSSPAASPERRSPRPSWTPSTPR
jgi:pyruvate dehydrogenase E1 component alpha subunit